MKSLSSANYKLLRSRYLLPLCDTLGRDHRIEDGYVLIHNETIKEVGPYNDTIGNDLLKRFCGDIDVIGSYNNSDIPMLDGVCLPSFVKVHGHDYQSNIIGVAKDCSLTQWLDDAVNPWSYMMHLECEELTEEFGYSPYYLSSLKAKLDDVSYGITASLSHHCDFCKYHVEELVQATNDIGVTIFIAVGSEDRNYPDPMLDLDPLVVVDRLERYHEEFYDGRTIFIVPGPDQFFSNTEKLFVAQKEWSNGKNTLFHTHSSEEPNTTKYFVETYGMTPVEYGYGMGVLDENTVLAHQVNCTDNDLKLLQETKTNIAHNPLANTLLGSGMPPILEMLDMGIPVAISTDGSGSADNQNMISAARLASQYQKAYHKDASVLPAQKVLEMCTIDAANMLKLNKGSITPGKDADMILIDLDSLNMTPTFLETVVENLIWAANGNEIQYVFSNGRMLMEDYEIKCGVDLNEVKKQIRRLTEKFFQHKKEHGKITGTGAHKE